MSEKSVASLLSKVSKETRDWKVLFDTRAVSSYPHRTIGGDNDEACWHRGMSGEFFREANPNACEEMTTRTGGRDDGVAQDAQRRRVREILTTDIQQVESKMCVKTVRSRE